MDAGEEVILVGVRHHQVHSGEARGLLRACRGPATGQDGAEPPPAAAYRFAGAAGRGPRHRAGVDDVEVRLDQGTDHLVAGGGKLASQALDLRLVQLAAEVGKVDAHGKCKRAGRGGRKHPVKAGRGRNSSRGEPSLG